MSVIETHLSDLRAGFGGYGFSSRLGLGSGPMLPLWRPTPAPAVSYCTSPTCPCSLPRPYIMSDLYDYPGFSYSWAAWYYKSGNLLQNFSLTTKYINGHLVREACWGQYVHRSIIWEAGWGY